MSDLDNMPEIETNTDQPNDVVATDLEIAEDTPLSEDNDQEEFVIEGEGDNDKPNDDEEVKRRAAYAKRKRKEREAKLEAQKEKERADNLQKQLDELNQKVGSIEKGPRPDPTNYHDQDEFYADLEKWNSGSKPASKKSEEQATASFEPDYEAEFKLDEGAEKLKKGGISDFDEKISTVKESLQGMGYEPESAFNYLISIASASGIDPSKASYMIGRNPDRILSEISKVDPNSGPAGTFKIAKIMEREAAKLSTRKKNSVDTQPEADVRQGAVKRSDVLADFGHFEE